MIGKPVSLQHYINVYLSLEHQCHKLCAQFPVALCGQGKEEQCPQSPQESHRWWLSLTGHWTSWYQLSLMIQVFTLTSSVQLARLCCWVYFDTSSVGTRGQQHLYTTHITRQQHSAVDTQKWPELGPRSHKNLLGCFAGTVVSSTWLDRTWQDQILHLQGWGQFN